MRKRRWMQKGDRAVSVAAGVEDVPRSDEYGTVAMGVLVACFLFVCFFAAFASVAMFQCSNT